MGISHEYHSAHTRAKRSRASFGLRLAGVIAANGKSQAVMETKLEELTREVQLHNNFARRMPVVEEQIRGLEHRMYELERGGRS